jgi:hypothetical protein
MTVIDKLKLLTVTDELDPVEVQAQFPEVIEMENSVIGGPLDTPKVKSMDMVLLNAILELDARLTQAGI